MTNQLKEFLKKVNSDESLEKKFAALKDESDREVVIQKTIKIAAEAGMTLTEVDFEPPEEEMDDDELEAVAGGWKKCYCAIGGGGKADEDGKACACVAEGLGESRRKPVWRCGCGFVGYGYDD